MSETPEQRRRRLRWLTLGEIIAVIAVTISALGLWKTWHDKPDKPLVVEKQATTVPLTLRGVAGKGGRSLLVEPVEAGHSLDSASLSFGSTKLELAGNAQLDAGDFERAVDKSDAAKDQKPGDGLHRLPLRIDARYVEAGQTRNSVANYALVYRWEEGGLFGGRSLRLVGLSLVSRGGR
jgi:hypothetical protein